MMSQEEGKREIVFQMTMSAARQMLEKGLISEEKNDTREILTNFINKLEDLTGKQTEFREELWGGLVDHIRIDEKSGTVIFRGGGLRLLFNEITI